jgi:hypothetical protein
MGLFFSGQESLIAWSLKMGPTCFPKRRWPVNDLGHAASQKSEGLVMKIFQIVAHGLDNTKPQLNSLYLFVHCATDPRRPEPPHCQGFEFTLKKTTLRRTPLDEWCPTQRPLPHNTQHAQETDIHSPGGIRTRSPIMHSAADPRHITRGHRHRLVFR